MTNASRNKMLTRIAKDVLRVPTLKTQKCGLDFHEVAVWQLKRALELAFQLGQCHPVKRRAPQVREVKP